ESFDMTSPYGRAMAQMASVFAELERAMIRERTRSAMSMKRTRGERISGHAPFRRDFGAGRRLVENVRERLCSGIAISGISVQPRHLFASDVLPGNLMHRNCLQSSGSHAAYHGGGVCPLCTETCTAIMLQRRPRTADHSPNAADAGGGNVVPGHRGTVGRGG